MAGESVGLGSAQIWAGGEESYDIVGIVRGMKAGVDMREGLGNTEG